jgi:RNA polymerase sigma factor (sigma-70 family)
MLSSREDAEDVLQEVFTAAFNAILADEREINVRPWLYRIARNRSLNHLRRATAVGVDSMDIHFAEQGISTGDKVLRRESFRQLIADVRQLPETQRTALLLREIDALSYEQIALAMETTVPSVKSLLVRARISLAEATEARKLSCAEVRLELGEVAEGLIKLGAPARRHVRDCERCHAFKKHLKDNNHALAAIFPVGPLLLVKHLLLTKLGSTASAGSAHVASGAGATAGATAGAASAAGAGTAGGVSAAGGILTAGAGALGAKAVAGLAAAAIVTAGAVAVNHPSHVTRHHQSSSQGTARLASAAEGPVVAREQPQPVSSTTPPSSRAVTAVTHHLRSHRSSAKAKTITAAVTPRATPVAEVAPPPVTPAPTKPAATPVTQVTTETTELPAAATQQPQPSTPAVPVSTPPPPSVAAPQPAAPQEPAPAPNPPAPTSEVPAPAPAQSPSEQTGGTPAPPASGG